MCYIAYSSAGGRSENGGGGGGTVIEVLSRKKGFIFT